MNCELRFSFQVEKEEAGTQLLPFLQRRLKEKFSGKAIKRTIDSKGCWVNGKVEIFSTYSLAVKDRIEIELGRSSPISKIQTFYEDEDLLLCGKPVGVISEAKSFPYPPIHRLDKETSGVLILVKNERMGAQMIALFKRKEVHKKYLALVEGMVAPALGTIDNFFEKKAEREGQTLWGIAQGKTDLRAITRWKKIASNKGVSLLLCEPVTGRTHQLRVHLASLGHPILGDHQYGKEFRSTLQPRRQMLHALEISFQQPRTKKQITVQAPLPEDFVESLERVEMAHALQRLDKEEQKKS
jgi:RluA family pseudouridine synthase